MKSVAVISQKGGSGKTTLSVHLAVAAHLSGLRTAIIDLDPQATARKWGDKRADEPEVIGDHAERLPQLVATARKNGAHLLVIDTAPNADRASLSAARAADLVLIPCRPAAFDLDAIETTRDLAKLAKKPAFILLNCAPPRSGITDEARQGLAKKGAKVVPITMHQRVAYSHSVIDGRTASEYEPNGRAAQETRDLLKWICHHLGMITRRPTGQRSKD